MRETTDLDFDLSITSEQLLPVEFPAAESGVPSLCYLEKMMVIEDEDLWLGEHEDLQFQVPRVGDDDGLRKREERQPCIVDVEEIEAQPIGAQTRSRQAAFGDLISLLSNTFHGGITEEFGECYVGERSVLIVDATMRLNQETMENHFPVFSFAKDESFVQSLCFPQLKFSVKSALPFEPMTKEWLRDLQLPDNSHFLEFHFGNGMWGSLLGRGVMTYQLNSGVELHDTVAIAERQDVMEEAPVERQQSVEDQLETVKLRVPCEINATHFDIDDVSMFAKLFENLDMSHRSLQSHILMQVENRFIAVLSWTNVDFSTDMMVKLCATYRTVLVISPNHPKFIGPTNIKWRCIASSQHVTNAIIPFITEEDSYGNKTIPTDFRNRTRYHPSG